MDPPPRKSIRARCASLAATLLLCLGPVPGLGEEAPGSDEVAGPVPEASATAADGDPNVPCDESRTEGAALVDKMQRGVYRSVCGAANWFDGLFGTRRYDQDSDSTFGRLGVYGLWDDRDGFDPKLRLRARVALPVMKDRMRLVFGRVDEREIEADTQPAGGSLPSSFQEVEDDAWLLGLGYSKQGGLRNGFDFGAGVRIRSPIDPYAKGSYRHNFSLTDATALRARETLFWRDSRGFGETTEIDVDHLISPQLLLRWDNTATLAEDVRRLEWTSALITFQSLGNRRAISYTGFVSGVTNTDVPVRNYGVELRYRQRFLREWLFLEARTSLTWPRETLEEKREINPGVGLGFEMYFGPVPEEQMR
jgi:hypothetical protein